MRRNVGKYELTWPEQQRNAAIQAINYFIMRFIFKDRPFLRCGS